MTLRLLEEPKLRLLAKKETYDYNKPVDWLKAFAPGDYKKEPPKDIMQESPLSKVFKLYLEEGQPALKYGATGKLESQNKSWENILREELPALSKIPIKKERYFKLPWMQEAIPVKGTLREYPYVAAGQLLEAGTKPSTFITWYAAQKTIPLALQKAIKKLPQKWQTILTQEIGRPKAPVDINIKSFIDIHKELGGIARHPKNVRLNRAELAKEYLKPNKAADYIKWLRSRPSELGQALIPGEAEGLAKPEDIGLPLAGKIAPSKGGEIAPKAPLRLLKEPTLATKEQKAQGHIIAQKKQYISEKGKVKPQYRRLAQSMTGKKSMKDMTDKEANVFISMISKLPEPIMKQGKLVPPSIPTTKKLTPQGFFQKKFKEPTFFKVFTPQTYYAQKLGVKPLVEPLEIAKQEFDISFRDYSNNVDRMIGKIDSLGKTTLAEKTQAKIRNLPTRAVSKMRDLLNTYEEAPDNLSQEEKNIFNYFRDLNRSIHNMENKVRESLDMNPIPYRKAYVRHTADAMAQEMLSGRYPFPEGLKYWSQQMVGQKVFNPMEMQRKLADDLEGLWTKDLAQATKSMLWTGLKEIHLSQPLKFFKEQLGAVSKDPAYYKNLTPSEREIVNAQQTIPASTKKWLIDYVNQVIKGQETYFDESINKLVTQSGLKGIFNKILTPFGRTVGRKPLTHLFQFAGRLTIHGVMGGVRPRQLIRNKFQTVQNLGLYTLKANLKAFLPATDKMKELMTSSLFLKTYSGFEELPINIMAMLEKANLAPFQWSALSNVKQAMKTSYWDTLDLITNPKHKALGWADPKRTYKEPKEYLYPSEKEKILKEMEFGAGVTQYHYIPMGMPEMFRHKALVPFTRLQSWWQNYFFKFNRECVSRALSGETGYGAKLPWSRRIGYLRYLILGGLILNTLGYERSFLFGAAPTGLPPTATLMLGLYNYVTADEDTTWGKRKKGQAKYQIINSLKTFIPAYMSVKDIIAVWEGRKDLKSLFFYTKVKKREATGEYKRQEFKRQEYQRQPFKRQELRLLR